MHVHNTHVQQHVVKFCTITFHLSLHPPSPPPPTHTHTGYPPIHRLVFSHSSHYGREVLINQHQISTREHMQVTVSYLII